MSFKNLKKRFDSYFQRINEIVNKLAAVSVIIEGEDLPNAYDMFKTSLRTRSQSVSFDELQILLRNEEKMLDKNSILDTANSVSALAMVANFEGNNRNNGRNRRINRGNSSFQTGGGNGGTRGRNNYSSNLNSSSHGQFSNPSADDYRSSNQITCQICQRSGHTTLDCYNLMNFSYEGRHPPSKLAAMNATTSSSDSFPLNSQVWLTDTGCNAHLTNDLSNLNVSSAYNGEDNIMVGAGQSLPITHQSCGQNHRPDTFSRT